MHTTNTSKTTQELQANTLTEEKGRLEKLQAKTRKGLIAALIGLSLSGGVYSCSTNPEQATSKKELSASELRKKPMNLGYKEINKEYKIDFIHFPQSSQEEIIKGKLSPREKILRCLRRKAITDAVEDKYAIPRGLLMAMMAQEGTGDPTLPNILNWKTDPQTGKVKISNSDGGLGLIHIQGANAEDFGLKVLQTNPNSKNSRKMKDTVLGQEIIKHYNTTTDLKELAKHDERWHPILAVDCAARFLKSKYSSKDGKDARIKALERYSGRKRTDYAVAVLKYRVTIDTYINQGTVENIPEFTEGVNEIIKQAKNSQEYKKFLDLITTIEVEINGEKGGYQLYLDYNAQQCDNYGLQEYINQQN